MTGHHTYHTYLIHIFQFTVDFLETTRSKIYRLLNLQIFTTIGILYIYLDYLFSGVKMYFTLLTWSFNFLLAITYYSWSFLTKGLVWLMSYNRNVQRAQCRSEKEDCRLKGKNIILSHFQASPSSRIFSPVVQSIKMSPSAGRRLFWMVRYNPVITPKSYAMSSWNTNVNFRNQAWNVMYEKYPYNKIQNTEKDSDCLHWQRKALRSDETKMELVTTLRGWEEKSFRTCALHKVDRSLIRFLQHFIRPLSRKLNHEHNLYSNKTKTLKHKAGFVKSWPQSYRKFVK